MDNNERMALFHEFIIFAETTGSAKCQMDTEDARFLYNLASRADLAQRVPETLTAYELNDACLSYRHDFGLMTEAERESLRREAADWWRCFERALNTPPKGGA